MFARKSRCLFAKQLNWELLGRKTVFHSGKLIVFHGDSSAVENQQNSRMVQLLNKQLMSLHVREKELSLRASLNLCKSALRIGLVQRSLIAVELQSVRAETAKWRGKSTLAMCL